MSMSVIRPRVWGLLAILVVMMGASVTACERTITEVQYVYDTVNVKTTDTLIVTHLDTVVLTKHDTAYIVRTDTVFRTDTVTRVVTHTDTVTRIDTLLQRDTLYRVDTLVRFDTTIVHDTINHTDTLVRVDTVFHTDTLYQVVTHVDTLYKIQYDTTYLTKTDTLYMPSQTVHDTTWIYMQTNPTNPFAGGDSIAGVAYIMVYDGYAIVFWHGHFVGVVHANNDRTFRAYVYIPGQMEMPMNGDWPTFVDAIMSLKPIEIVLTPNSPDRVPIERSIIGQDKPRLSKGSP